ncbi:zinc finger protein ENHYDROUS-like isoform X2 [Andrographis paniculata]|uniref:zinc finger protein ENHYDROUS-like isoform X2 n=1 Tax=Andrographis paniculata TaxID=175694 RepID=UPI0021E8AC5E|nr:zinc finger protein ENHYDROUS-like isoform X2 [Andrographis paniculata]
MNDSTASGDSSSGKQAAAPLKPVAKKKRNLPGMPDPDAEVIALSPHTLLATNRFVCEICNKGFQRDQNLQLHRRGHNLPWKLRQRSSKEVRKKVYVCPEPSCEHHNPSRALGDLTGIKKHFCRKHGEKKWKCEKCSKKYAVQSDWKAHSKICGTKEYKCDCGTVFSRRDSFITHRAFCDALAEESAKEKPAKGLPSADENPKTGIVSIPPAPAPAEAALSPPLPPQNEEETPAPPVLLKSSIDAISSPVLPDENPEMVGSQNNNLTTAQILELEETPTVTNLVANCSSSSCSSSNGSSTSNVFASLFASSTSARSLQSQSQTAGFTDLLQTITQPARTQDLSAASLSLEPVALCLAVNQGSSIFGTAGQELRQYAPAPQPAMSATALLQKAAQVGASAPNGSLLLSLGIVSPSASPNVSRELSQQQKLEPDGLGLGLACDSGSGLKELMLGTPSVFGPKHATLDLLGLGMAASGGSTSGLSALITSINGGPNNINAAAAESPRGGREHSSHDRMPAQNQ